MSEKPISPLATLGKVGRASAARPCVRRAGWPQRPASALSATFTRAAPTAAPRPKVV